MALIRREMNKALVEASRTNGRKSTGPRSERGKAASRFNAARHWGRAGVMYDHMPALDEDPRDFAAVLDGLHQALQPRDAFEEMLVNDMADIHWRLRRMIRGESGMLAARRRKEQARLEELDARMASGALHMLEPSVVAQVGYVGLNDSPAKFTYLIEMLKALDALVESEGFHGAGTAYFQTVYGSEPSLRGGAVIAEFRRCYEDQKAGRDELSAANRADFRGVLASEIAWFEKGAARDRQARAELEAPQTDSMLTFPKDSRTSGIYQERLERRFERKWRLLQEYRRGEPARQERERIAEPPVVG